MPEPTAEEKAAAEAKAKADADAKALADAAEAKARADAAAAEVKLTQGDVDRLVGDARTKARTAAEKELLEKLGVPDFDAAAATIKAAKDAEDAGKTEAERLTAENERLKAEAERATKLATSTLALTRVEGALRDAGLKPERIQAAMKLIDLDSLKVEGTDVTGIAEAVERLKTETPEFFGTTRRTAADATGGTDPGATDYRTAPREDVAKALRDRFGINL